MAFGTFWCIRPIVCRLGKLLEPVIWHGLVLNPIKLTNNHYRNRRCQMEILQRTSHSAVGLNWSQAKVHKTKVDPFAFQMLLFTHLFFTLPNFSYIYSLFLFFFFFKQLNHIQWEGIDIYGTIFIYKIIVQFDIVKGGGKWWESKKKTRTSSWLKCICHFSWNKSHCGFSSQAIFFKPLDSQPWKKTSVETINLFKRKNDHCQYCIGSINE